MQEKEIQMKIFTIVLAAALSIGAAFASPADTLMVKFASPVLVGDKLLPAGDATVSILRGASNYIILNVRAENGANAAVVVNRISNTDESISTSVVLGKRGNVLKLEKIWLDDHTGFEVTPEAQ